MRVLSLHSERMCMCSKVKGESEDLYKRLQEKRARRSNYQRQYRSDDYAELHKQIWNQQHAKYYTQWRQQHLDYHKEYCHKWRNKNPIYTKNKNKKWRQEHPNYFKKYRRRNKRKMRKYWREYKRKVRAKVK